jgi:hypothetical protein
MFGKDLDTGKRVEIGGSIIELPVKTVQTKYNEINVRPASVSDFKDGTCSNDQCVCLHLGSSSTWLDLEQTGALIEFLQRAVHVASVNRLVNTLSMRKK